MKTITNFWNYFQQNNFVFLLLNEIPKEELKTHFDKLIEILHQYNKDPDLIIKNKSNGAELIITAHGNPYLFKEVELLVLNPHPLRCLDFNLSIYHLKLIVVL